ncbi:MULTISPECIES: ATP-binding protein [unclassified Marinobacterium]|jgi:two-component system, LuxR family, sensor kinase FixL|uniref:PAS domain-containing sensor histidine kinase n=1 Tax=unclassified Marinobacterium TaxID=2644139 RepID=UPI0015686150|nr:MULTISPECIES: ATP-binding protein [unclassified Marinobacterium]NRP10644.1 Sensor protein FixL [Marinobacterium sp. xm-g-48]NRP36867.1 Sensor protein FixL [Marinobacterium sp. xm-d-579]NRP46764.1 Sensor protein FixL [Marinobacterium sp. xm-d-543]NRP83652.1 Sensor protein FixL [Marinobacterium sp. xm-d-509]NRQ01990.1 Sensor protein FixL [Marinobacterium sp. xm-d-530]
MIKPIDELQNCREDADRYRLLAEQSTDMISRHTTSPDWTYIDVSPAVEKILGYTAEEIIGTSGYAAFHPNDADNLTKRDASVRYREGLYSNIYRYRHKAGHYIWLETTSRVIRDSAGKPLEIICVSRDVTEREEIQQTMARLARVVEASSDMIMFCNHETHRLTYLNESAYHTLGTEQETPVSYYLPELFTQEIYHSLVCDALKHAFDHGVWYGSIPMELPDSLERVAEIREIIAHRNRREDDKVDYYSIIGRDITLKLRAEEAAKRHQLEIAHMSRLMSVSEMAAGLAHEINQPLATILNYCHGTALRLSEGVTNPVETVTQSMKLITQQAKRASDIIKRMRAFVAKTEHHQVEFSINECCREVSTFLYQEALDHNIRFIFELAKQDPLLVADKIQIEQVLLNLIRNAIEAYSDCERSQRSVTIKTELNEKQLVIHVEDKGSGISQEGLERLFEPFYTSKSTGLGMGLSISRTIIETHGGQLYATSDAEDGTRFTLKLPIRD